MRLGRQVWGTPLAQCSLVQILFARCPLLARRYVVMTCVIAQQRAWRLLEFQPCHFAGAVRVHNHARHCGRHRLRLRRFVLFQR